MEPQAETIPKSYGWRWITIILILGFIFGYMINQERVQSKVAKQGYEHKVDSLKTLNIELFKENEFLKNIEIRYQDSITKLRTQILFLKEQETVERIKLQTKIIEHEKTIMLIKSGDINTIVRILSGH